MNETNRRILVIDDNVAIHDDFRKILCRGRGKQDDILDAFFDESGPRGDDEPAFEFEIDSAMQGSDGLRMVSEAQAAGRPYAMAFVDMRMPPGWDGLETIQRIWAGYPDLQVVICTAYSDRSWAEIIASLGESDQLVILKKPFDPVEARQLAIALTKKWRLTQQARLRMEELRALVETRTTEIAAARDELARINRDLESARLAAEAANRSKSEFLANVSHEIRTPITAILGFAEELRTDAADGVLIKDREWALETIIRNGHHLLQVINDVLDLSKIEAGKLNVEFVVCSLPQIVSEVLALMHVRAADRGLYLANEFVAGVPESIATDPLRVRQVLINLIGNAIKFTHAGGVRLKVSASHERRPEGTLRFDVTDTGIGMSAAQIHRIFRPFEQADSSTSRVYGGTGLGLSISRRLVEMLGGRIEVESAEGKGTTFSFTIDNDPARIAENRAADPAAAAAARVEPPSSARCEGARVLLCEDGKDNQRLIARILQRAGAEVTVCEDGREGLAAALDARKAGTPFDLILMDVSMPIMDGYTATRRLREAGYEGPIVALTAHAMPSDRQACLDAGCDDYATKPIDRPSFLATVSRWSLAENKAMQCQTI